MFKITEREEAGSSIFLVLRYKKARESNEGCAVELKVKSGRKFTYITSILKSFHWLKVNERIEYKILSHI